MRGIRAKEPIQCQACKRLFMPNQVIINHHVTYFPEKIIQIHGSCHSRIHVGKTMYQHLRPDPRQILRWYKKKNSNYVYHTDADDYTIRKWFDRLWYTLMTLEQREEYDNNAVQRYWNSISEECQRKSKGLIDRI